MTSDATFEDVPAPIRRFRLRFSLLALLVFITLVCLLLAWWVQPNRVVATAMFRVSRDVPTVLGDGSDRLDETEFEIVKKSQMAAMKSYFVLQSAVRKPGIASLPILAPHEDPVEWLSDNLEVAFPQEGEYLEISLHGVEEHSADLARIVDAVAKAYKDEVLFKETQRELADRDMLARTLSSLNSEFQDKWDQLLDIARESGRPDSETGNSMQELLMKRLDRIESELMRLEDEQLRLQTSGESGNTKFYEQRIAQLRDRQTELEKTIATRAEVSVELTMRKNELERLQRIVNDMSNKFETLEIEANAQSRIEQVQDAVVSPAD